MRPREDQKSGPDTIFFDSLFKCCTYVPNIPNFLVGRILVDAEPAAQYGRATVQKRIADAVGVTPLGLAPPPVHSLLYRSSADAFGRSRALRCPHYLDEGGRCGIWRNRNAVCATWFCKHVRGQVGYTFWRDSLERVLRAVEADLARWCVLELQLGADALRLLAANGDWTFEAGTVTGDSLDNRVDQAAYARIWGAWHGSQQEYFCRCGELISQLGWTDALALCGTEARGYARLTHEAYARLTSDDIPSHLRTGSFQVTQIRGAMTRVNSYHNSFDPLDVPDTVMQLLQYFDGRPTPDALAAIAEQRGVSLDAALVRKLVDFKLLIPAEMPVSAPEAPC
jgi:hypothetical protein